jgi:hypothetical protein
MWEYCLLLSFLFQLLDLPSIIVFVGLCGFIFCLVPQIELCAIIIVFVAPIYLNYENLTLL